MPHKKSDLTRYGTVLEELKNTSFVGRDEYPNSPADVYDLLVRQSGFFNMNIMNRRGESCGSRSSCGNFSFT